MEDSKHIEFQDFCKETSLHGWNYLLSEEKWKVLTTLKRVLWSIIILSTAIVCSYFVVSRTIEYIESDVAIMLESRSGNLSEVYFPSIVVCNMNPLRKSFMYEILDTTSIDKGDITPLWNEIIKTYFSGSDQSKCMPTQDKLDQLMFEFRHSAKYKELATAFMENEVIEESISNFHNTTKV